MTSARAYASASEHRAHRSASAEKRDLRPRARGRYVASAHGRGAETVGMPRTRDDMITEAYGRLASLARLLPSRPEFKAQYDAELAALRSLQREEAQELRTRVQARRALTEESLAEALLHADRLLERHARSQRLSADIVLTSVGRPLKAREVVPGNVVSPRGVRPTLEQSRSGFERLAMQQ